MWSRSQEMTDARRAEIEAEVEQVAFELYESLKPADGRLWMATLHESTGLWLDALGAYNLRERSETYLGDWTSEDTIHPVRQEYDDLEIQAVAVSPTVVFVTATSPDRRWYLSNGEISRTASAESWLFVNAGDGWKLHSGQTALFPLEDEVDSEEA